MPQSLIKACMHNGTSSIVSLLGLLRVPIPHFFFDRDYMSQTRDGSTSRLQLLMTSAPYGTSTSIPDACTAIVSCVQPQVVELINPTIHCSCPAILPTIVVPAEYSTKCTPSSRTSWTSTLAGCDTLQDVQRQVLLRWIFRG
jgi:hypothetical protein